MPKRRMTWLVVLVLVSAVTGAGSAFASRAARADDREAGDASEVAEDSAEGPDVPISGGDLARATEVALDHLGEGRVTATEVGDEESFYEVEVSLDDGRQVDVQLDESFEVVGLG